MEDKIAKALEYYTFKSEEIWSFINTNSDLTVDKIIESGEELSILESKILALEIAKVS